MALGRNYLREGLYDQSVKQCLVVLKDLKIELGNDHPHTIACQETLSYAYVAQKKFADAEQLWREILTSYVNTQGRNHIATLNAKAQLANVMSRQGKYDEAISMAKEILADMADRYGKQHSDIPGMKQALAVHFSRNGQWKEAIQLMEEVYQHREETLGPLHLSTQNDLNSLANFRFHNGEQELAVANFLELLDRRVRSLGLAHPTTLKTIDDLASVHNELGRLEDFVIHFKEYADRHQEQQNDDGANSTKINNKLSGLCSNLAWKSANSLDLKQHDYEKSVRWARTALKFHDHYNNWNNLGAALYRNGQYQEAVDALRKADEILEGKDRFHRPFLAMSLWHLGQKEEALRYARQYIAWHLAGNRGNEQKRFLAELEELLGLLPDNHQQTAFDYYQTALKEDPHNQDALQERIALLGRLKLWDQQIRDLQRLLALTPEDASRWNQLAWAHQQLQQYADALKAADQAIAADPEYPAGHVRRAKALLGLKDYGGAVESATRAIALEPDRLEPYPTRAQASIRLGKWSNAVRDYEQFNRHGNPSQYTFLYEALLHLKVGDLPGYQQTCRRMLDQYLKQPSAKYAKYMLESCGYAELPPELLSQLIDIGEEQLTQNPKSAELFRHVGILFDRRGDYKRAAQLLATARELGDGSHAIQIWTAIAEYRLGNTSLAQEWFSRIPETFPSGPLDWQVRQAELQLPLYRREAAALIPLPSKAPKP